MDANSADERIANALATLNTFGRESFDFRDVWELISDVKADLSAPIPTAAQRVVEEWDRWQSYLRDIGIEQPENGIAPFLSALEDLRRSR